MRLICPDCGAQYEVPTRVIPVQGRDVQCSACGNTWFQTREEDETPQVTETVVAPAPQTSEYGDNAAEDQSPVPPNGPAQAAPPPAPQEDVDAPTPDGDIDPAPARRSLDPSIAELLREEAQREQAARLLGKSSHQPTVSQDPVTSVQSESATQPEIDEDTIVPPLAAALDAHEQPKEDMIQEIPLEDEEDAQPLAQSTDGAAEDESSSSPDDGDDIPMPPAQDKEVPEGSQDVAPVHDMPSEETPATQWDEADFVETLSSEATADILSDPEDWHDVDTPVPPSDLEPSEPEESATDEGNIAEDESESVEESASLDTDAEDAAETLEETEEDTIDPIAQEDAPAPLSSDGDDHIDPDYDTVQISRQDIEDSTIPDGQLAAMAVAQNSTERRHRLPDIEEMSQSWSVVDETDARADLEEQRRAQSQRSKAGFNFGFFTIVFLAIASAMIYWRADDIIDQLPQAEAPLDLYVEKVDELRALVKDQANSVGLWVIDLAEKIKAESAVSE